jgi:hypothetical protein
VPHPFHSSLFDHPNNFFCSHALLICSTYYCEFLLCLT